MPADIVPAGLRPGGDARRAADARTVLRRRRRGWSGPTSMGRSSRRTRRVAEREAVVRCGAGRPAAAAQSRGSTRSCRPRPSQRVCDLALTSTSPSVIENHRAFHELLLVGRSGLVRRPGRERAATTTRGWSTSTSPGNNEFVAVNQLTIIVGEKNRRPDILLFVNGLPLGQIELKAPGTRGRRRRRGQPGSALHRDDPRCTATSRSSACPT